MKTTKAIFPITMLCFLALPMMQAQDCSAYFPFKKGATMAYTTYDDKDKVLASQTQKVTIIEDKGDDGLVAQINMVLYDKKGEQSMDGDYKISCKDNTLFMDVTATMPQLTEAFSSMEVTMTGNELQIPSKLSVGQTLPDASMEIQAASGGLNIMKMNIEVVDRKVEAKETVTTPAGTYECYKISQYTNTKMLVGKSFKTVNWYAANVGLVRTENYNKKGRLESYMVLTKFSEE